MQNTTLHRLAVIACIIILIGIIGISVVMQSDSSLLREGVAGHEHINASSSTHGVFNDARMKDARTGAVCQLAGSASTTAFVRGNTLHLVRDIVREQRWHILVKDNTVYTWRDDTRNGTQRALSNNVSRSATTSQSAIFFATSSDPFSDTFTTREHYTEYVRRNLDQCVSTSISRALRTPPPVVFHKRTDRSGDRAPGTGTTTRG